MSFTTEIMKNADLLGKKLNYAQYTAVLFVSPNGDNTNGSSWSKAYTTLAGAITAASAAAGDRTLIVVAQGTYADVISFSKSVTIFGVNNAGVIITANMTITDSAVGIVELRNIQFQNATLTINENAFIIDNSIFNYTLGAPATIITINPTGTTIDSIISNCSFIGDVANTTAISAVAKVTRTVITNCTFLSCLVGVSMTSVATTLDNTIINCVFRTCATGISIGAAVLRTVVENIGFWGCTTMLADASATAIVKPETIHSNAEVPQMYPADPAALVTLTGGAGAGAYGAWTQIIPPATFTRPFVITYVVHGTPSAAADTYFMQLGIGAAPAAALITFPLRAALGGIAVLLNGAYIPANSEITARIATTSGGADTVTVALQIIQL